MSARMLVAIVAGLLDLYLLWTLLRALEGGVISTKWGKIFRDNAPKRFWLSWCAQMLLALVLFPMLILQFARGG